MSSFQVGDRVIVKPGVWYGKDISGQVGTIVGQKKMFSLSLGKEIDYFYMRWETKDSWPIHSFISCPEFWFDHKGELQ